MAHMKGQIKISEKELNKMKISNQMQNSKSEEKIGRLCDISKCVKIQIIGMTEGEEEEQ